MAQAVHAHTQSAFVAQLLAPIQERPDKKAKKVARAFAREIRYQFEEAWRLACHRYHAAMAHREQCIHLLRVGEIERRRLVVPEAVHAERAQLEVIARIDDLMRVPAPTIGALRFKQKLRMTNGGRDRWEAAIAADEMRLQ